MKDFDYFCFHTPFSKMVQESFDRMCLNEGNNKEETQKVQSFNLVVE